eukprot:CAMPEP_0116128936 /NCGR_PEP_ID=MMETSP0329-20121206/7657_1 /TAXON_ID=697910 /ORGANISM="Pseudo-nitzschia arenysensis, Strain B593" /LENGTH=318 /DNA_ID=CAMNT_0003623171 /DNA_START=324 /DNA_END=1280 /DNA_ORIENTATION=-
MGYLHEVSDSDIQSENLLLVDPPVHIGIGSTVATTLADSNKINKKRKRENTSLTTSVRAESFNEISDDSDVSSDDEKPPQQAQHCLGIHKRRQHNKTRRKVVFGDASSTTTYHPSPVTKAQLRKLKKDLWFTKQDRLKSQAECLKVLKNFRVQNAEEVARFSNVYKTSMNPLSQESSDYLEKATVSIPLTIRGMEWGIAPKLKKRRKEHIRSVLSLQENIQDTELRARFVSSRSVQSSRPARIMARIIGEGDASAGTTSTALNVTTVPMKKTTPAAEKLPLGEQEQNTKAASGCGTETKKRTKLGHARRKRRAVLWRK